MYLEQRDEEHHGQPLQVHLLAHVQLLPELPGDPAVARPAEHPLCGRALPPQQHQHDLEEANGRQCMRMCVCVFHGMTSLQSTLWMSLSLFY